MSDDVSIYGDDGREYHSRFDLGLELAAMETIKWLILGHLFFLVGLALVLLLRVDMGPVWVTPLFGAPLLWAGRARPDWLRVAAFVIGFTAIHYLAITAAQKTVVPGSPLLPDSNPLLPGFYAGMIGALGSFALCLLFRQLREGAATLIFAAFGSLILACAGSFSVYMYLSTGAAGNSFANAYVQMVIIYTPWQLLFAYFLAKTLKPIGD